ncbi:MAG: DNA-formamidopyrimidine glycosylase [Firmicutes bacterium]|nr:DNA-formamidopyrimidine glycosylase [Bacillota bacterium]
MNYVPELAEVETVRLVLKKQILNKKIKEIKILYPNIIESDINDFKSALKGSSFIDIQRKGKYLIFETPHQYLISHLRMEGKYFIKKHSEEISKHEHIIFVFEDFDLRYHDTRKFGRMVLINKDSLTQYFKNLGPDANGKVDSNYLYSKIHNKKVPIKTLLLDQSIISGLGNIYVDEVLHASKINPFEYGTNITINDTKNILENSKRILDMAIKYKGTTIRSYTSSLNVQGEYQNYLKVHTKEGDTCFCKSVIVKDKVGGRSTYFCPNCQRLK